MPILWVNCGLCLLTEPQRTEEHLVVNELANDALVLSPYTALLLTMAVRNSIRKLAQSY